MLDRMIHRGPDDEHHWLEGHAAIGARRLSVLDVDRGRQPVVSADGNWVVALNGEIYNHLELRPELEAKGARFETTCDTETLLHAVIAWGDAAATRFNGMFAFAAYDRARNRLLLVRDRLGIKPLYYAQTQGALLFASELDPLIGSGLVANEINPEAVDAYFTWQYVPAPMTIYRGAWKLRPGERIVWQDGVVTETRWRAPDYAPGNKPALQEAAAQFRHHLDDAVRLQRLSDRPLGAFLSGGVDSSCVVAALAAQSSAPVKTFSIGFDDPDANELPYARQVAERFGTEHTEAVLSADLVALLPELAVRFGEPFADSSAIPTWLVSKLAREQVVVVLSGDGGDELFAGYTWLHRTLAVARYQQLPRALRLVIAKATQFLGDSPFNGKLRRFAADGLSPIETAFARRHMTFNGAQRAALFTPEFARRVRIHGTTALDPACAAELSGLPPRERMLAYDLLTYLPDDILTKVDRMSMAHSLEARVPLLDHRLVEFANALPFHLKYDGHTSKRVMKAAYAPELPQEIVRQRKRGFSIPLDRWFRGTWRAFGEEVLFDTRAMHRNYLDLDAVRRLWNEHQTHRENHGHRLWAMIVFEHWLRYWKAS